MQFGSKISQRTQKGSKMRGKKRVQRSYSPEEKAEALEELALNGGNLSKTAKETGIPVSSLCRWRDEQLCGSMGPQAKNMAKFTKNAWRNIHTLNSPKFIKQLKAKALEKGNLKEVFASISILVDKMTILARLEVKTSKEAKSDELEENLSEEDLNRMIKEEEEKARRERRAGQD